MATLTKWQEAIFQDGLNKTHIFKNESGAIMKLKISPRSMLLLISLCFSCFFPLHTSAQNNVSSSVKESAIPLSQDDLYLFLKVIQQIKSAYVDRIEDKILVQNAIKGMVQGLDSHSSWLPPENFARLKESAAGEFAGIGAEVRIKEGAIHVIQPLPGSPASRAGILPGDKIISMNGIAVKILSEKEISGYMRGKPGSMLSLTIIRKENNKPLIFNIRREIIKLISVTSQRLGKNREYGYLHVSHFQKNTRDEMIEHILKLNKSDELKGLILDLRDNPGGVLQAAIDVADIFIDNGTIVSTRGRLSNSNIKFIANNNDITSGLPIVVLINESSASSAEIVAGALQDHDRAVIIGKRSYGKGSIQSIIPINGMQHNSAIKLTTARYYTPDGISINTRGITPDIEVNVSTTDYTPEKIGKPRDKREDDKILSQALNSIQAMASAEENT